MPQQIYILRTLRIGTGIYQRMQEQSSSAFLQEPLRKKRHSLSSLILINTITIVLIIMITFMMVSVKVVLNACMFVV